MSARRAPPQRRALGEDEMPYIAAAPADRAAHEGAERTLVAAWLLGQVPAAALPWPLPFARA